MGSVFDEIIEAKKAMAPDKLAELWTSIRSQAKYEVLELIWRNLDAPWSIRKTMEAKEKLRKSTSGEAWIKDLFSSITTFNQDL